MLKWLKRISLGLATIVIAVILGGVGFEQWSRWSVARDFPPSGQVIMIDGAAMHLHCSGTGSPTVVLEAGLDITGSLAWATVQPEISSLTRVCSYDRAGIYRSERRSEIPTARGISGRLHSLLEAASETPPYVLVGHSLGGPLIRVFADRYPQDVAGLVFVDASHPDQMQRFSAESVAAMDGPSPILLSTLAATGMLRLSDAPFPENMPAEARSIAKRFAPQSIPGVLSELETLETILAEAGESAGFGNLPLIVLAAGRLPDELPPGMTEELAADISTVWSELQAEHTTLSTNSEQRVIEDATHYIQFDNPDAVNRAIRDVVEIVRNSQPMDNAGENVLKDGGYFDCLPIDDFGLKGLRLSEPENSIRRLLGEPLSVETGWSEDDGGRHDVVTYEYEGLEVDAVRGDVDRIFTDSSITSTPSGIHVGQSLTEMVSIFGREPRGLDAAPTKIQIVTCPVNGEWLREDYATFEIDSNEVLISIEYAVNRP